MNCSRFFFLCAVALSALTAPAASAAETRFTYHPSGEMLTMTSSGVSAPTINRQPQAVQGEVGQIVVLSVGATGTAPLAYAWYKDSNPTPVGTGPALVFSPFAATDAGNYTVAVTNGQGTATSQAVALTVAVVDDPLAAALGTTGQVWRRGGTSLWKPTTVPSATHDGSSAITSGTSVYDTSYVETDIVGPKTLSFWVKLTGTGGFSSDAWGSKFSLVVNGLPVRRYANYQSGFSETQLPADTWQQLTFDLPPGTWTVRWERYDTSNQSAGSSISLDDVVLTTPADTDNDGLSDDWERRFFSNSLASGPGDNPDADSSDNLTEYQDISLPQESSANVMGALNYHLYTAVQGSGSIALSPAQGPLGYATSTPPPTQQFNPRNTEILVTAVPGPGQVFAAWLDREHNTDYTTNPLSSVKFDGRPVPYDRNPFNAMKSRKLTAVFSPAISLAEALDTPGRVWTTGGDAPFIGQNFYTDDGVDAARSGYSSGSGSQQTDSWIETQITGPAMVSWRQLQKGFTGYYSVQMDDFLGDSLTNFYELGAWRSGSIYIPTGTHTVRWNVHDYGNNAARSAFAFDQMVITPSADSDHDGLGDDWELAKFGNLDRDGTLDSDNDGATDREEYERLTDTGMPVRRMPFTVTATTGGTATLSPTRSAYLMGYTYFGGEAENVGETVTIDAVPAANYRFDEWQDGRGEALTGVNSVLIPSHYNLNLTYPPPGLALKAIFSPLLGEALDYPTLTFNNGDRRWRTRTSVTHDGSDAATTTRLSGNDNTEMSTTINGPAVVSFWWKCSGEAGKFTTSFFSNGATKQISGETDWRREFVVIPPGQSNLVWSAYCNSSGQGSNQAWVDQLQIDTDTDQNGLGDDWELQYFGATGVDPNDDFDHDGTTNQEEFGDHTHPKQATSAVYRLTVISPESGAVSVSPAIGPHAPGTQITVTADPALTGWSGDATGAANPLVVTLDRNKTVTASFNPLALGADNTKLVWTTGGAQPWTAEIPATSLSSPTYDLNYSAGPTLTAGQQSWIQTTVTGPSVVSFKGALFGAATPDYSSYISRFFWSVDGTQKGEVGMDFVYGAQETVYVPSGTHVVRWTFERGAGETYTATSPPLGAFLDEVRVLPQPAAPLTLAQAVDNTALTFTTSGVSPWLGGGTVTHDGTDAAFAWGTPRRGQSTMETTVPGAGAVTFWWKVLANYNKHYLRFLVDGQPAVPAISGDSGWAKITYTVHGAGPHTLQWVYEKNGDPSLDPDGAWVDQVAFVATPIIPLAQALDTTGLTWTSGGATSWSGIDTVSFDGVDAAESGPISDGQETWVQTTVTGPGTLDFQWKASCKDIDIAIVYMDGSRYFADDYIQGEVDWKPNSLSIPAGTHTIKWRYFKDSSSSSYIQPGRQDRVWLDQVSFTSSSGSPEISIEQPVGKIIADRGISAFGTVAVNSTTIQTFTIKNIGTARLNDIAVAMLDFEQQDFKILPTPVPATRLLPGESTTFQVKFNPTSLGVKGAWIGVVSDDSDETVHEIRLTGTAAPPPEISIEQPVGTPLTDGVSSISFGTVNTGSIASLTFTIKNSGAGGLAGLAVSANGDNPGDFAITAPPATVATNKSGTFTVKFSPGGVGLRQAVLHVASNDADESPFDIQVTGTGVAAKPVFPQVPQPQLVGTGQQATFSAGAVGSGTLTYKWLKNGGAAPGSTNANTYTIASATLAAAGNYAAAATNTLGTGTSAAAPLTVVSLASSSLTVNEDTTLTLKAVLAAPAGVPLTYRWKKAGTTLVNGGVAPAQVISGATTGTLSITKASAAETAAYTCVIGMGALTKESGEFNVTVRLKPVMDNPGALAWSVSQTITTQFTAQNSPTSFTFTNLPAGVIGNTTTGKLSGQPNLPTTASSKPFTVTATNLAGKSATITVNYTVAALPAAAIGTFNGLVERNTALAAPMVLPAGQKLQGHGGRLGNLVVTATGLFTGTLQVEEKSYAMPAKSRLEGIVGADPAAHVVIPRGTGIASLILDFAINRVSGELTGSVSDGTAATPASVRAWRQTAPSGVQVGTYTAVLQLDPALVGTDPSTTPPGSPANFAYPQGRGYLTLKLDAKGAATWGGKLADGTAITGSSSMGLTGALPFFQLPYGSVATTTGSATGWVTLAPDSLVPQNDGRPLLDGLLTWNKKPQSNTSTVRSYKAGFAQHNLTVVGGLYKAPLATAIIFDLPDVTLPAVNARLSFSEGGLTGPPPVVPAVMAGNLAKNWRIGKNHVPALPAGTSNPAIVAFTLAPAAGTFTGTFTLKNDPDATKPPTLLSRPVTYYGILVPRLSRGYGQFQLPQLPVLSPSKTTLLTSPQYSGQVLLERFTGN